MVHKIKGITFSHKGNYRSNNEDATHWGPANDTAFESEAISGGDPFSNPLLAAVADGVGGCVAGEEASELAITAVKQKLQEGAANIPDLLAGALENAHTQIVDSFKSDPSKDGMATTYTGLYFSQKDAFLMHIGDSRCYRYTGRKLKQESVDHSPVGKMVAEGRLTEEEALIHPYRSYVDRVLGNTDTPIEPHIAPIPLKRGDRWLLCTDGLSDSLYPEQIENLFHTHAQDSIETLALRLMDAALDNAGRDNISIALIEIGQPSIWQKTRQMLERGLKPKQASLKGRKQPTSSP